MLTSKPILGHLLVCTEHLPPSPPLLALLVVVVVVAAATTASVLMAEPFIYTAQCRSRTYTK